MLTTATETDICYRIDAAGNGRGGKIAVTHGTPDVDVTTIGVPTHDSNAGACTTTAGNQLATPHPISDGTIATIDYSVDAYVNTSVGAWLCLEVESLSQRVVVPMSLPGFSVDPNITVNHYQD